jgi:hypothetical protein
MSMTKQKETDNFGVQDDRREDNIKVDPKLKVLEYVKRIYVA